MRGGIGRLAFPATGTAREPSPNFFDLKSVASSLEVFSAEPLPHWDLSNVYAGLEADDYRRDFARLDEGLRRTGRTVRRPGIGRLAEAARRAPDAPARDAGRRSSTGLNELGRLSDTLVGICLCLLQHRQLQHRRRPRSLEAGTARRAPAKARRAPAGVDRQPEPRGSTIGSADDRLLGEHQFFLHNSARRSRYLMSEELEAPGGRVVRRRRRRLRQAARQRHQPTGRCRWSATARPSNCRSPPSAISSSIPIRRCASGRIGPNRPAGNRSARRWPPA